MADYVILLSIPGLRAKDVGRMPRLKQLVEGGDQAPLAPSFPCVTWPVQSNMLTGKLPAEHGVVANGFYWRRQQEVEMWTAWNDKILSPQIWDILHDHDSSLASAAWFPMLSKGSGADYVFMPATIHNPYGSESLWCYTKPVQLYGVLRDELGHFPLKHFWGPLANIQSTAWIVDSAVVAARQYRPHFYYLYLPHLDYAAQKVGPDSAPALAAVEELDQVIGKLVDGFQSAYGQSRLLYLVASEYAIVPVDHVSYPNRVLRQAGLLEVRTEEDGEHLDLNESRAWALVDHQFSHVFVRDSDPESIGRVVDLFRKEQGIAEVLAGSERDKYQINHQRAGEVILISQPTSWQAYYWWEDAARAPGYARTVDIHRKPGYDPVELHWDMANRCVPLDASLIKGSHGAPATTDAQRGVLLSSQKGVFVERPLPDTDVADLVLRQFGI